MINFLVYTTVHAININQNLTMAEPFVSFKLPRSNRN